MSGLSDEDRDLLTDSIVFDGMNGGDRATFEAVEAIVTRAVNAALNDAAKEIEGWREMSHRRADDRSKDDHDRSKAIQRGNAYDRAIRIVRARTN